MRDPITTLSMMERILIVALTSSVREGFLPFRGYRTWYRLIGDFTPTAKGTFPLLTLHRGPGIPHDSLEPLEEFAETSRPVIFYDQLGCGHSDCPDDPSLWQVNLFLEEITAVRHHLALDQIHLFGHSWRGALALEYALTQPNGLISLTIASSFANAPRMLADRQRVEDPLSCESVSYVSPVPGMAIRPNRGKPSPCGSKLSIGLSVTSRFAPKSTTIAHSSPYRKDFCIWPM